MSTLQARNQMQVTITANEDGSFSVESPSAEGQPEELLGSTPAALPSLDAALDVARSMLSEGQSDKPMMDGEADFLAGFKGANGDQGY